MELDADFEVDVQRLADGERPRKLADEAKRRILRLGGQSLTDHELVALVTGASAEATARLLDDGLRALLAEPPDSLLEHPSLDSAAAARLMASAELARRLHHAPEKRLRLATPQAIYEWARPQLVGLRREEFHVLCLNSRNVLLRHVRVAEGSIDQCHVDPREALAPAVACRATGIVLLHNHPSGDPEPSTHDVVITRQLREAARFLCIRLHDHLVLGDNSFVSMLGRGLLGGDDRAFIGRLQSP